MGYYSEVRICTSRAGFERFKELVPDEGKALFETGQLKGYGNSVIFGWEFVKWYEWLPDVTAIMRAMDLLCSEGYPLEFIRIGENYDDNDERHYNDTSELSRHIYITRRISTY